MNIGPILHRELRRQSRQWPTYWLRVLGGALVLAACAWGLTVTHALMRQLPAFAGLPAPSDGRGLFVGLNKLMACLVWLVGPLLTADCLAREKREGTLGLLFLTPLRPTDVVVGKAASHALRALMVLLAAYPVLMLPVLLGGVTWADAARMFLLQLAVLGLALAAGVTASALSREWLRTRLLAFTLTVLASVVFVGVYLGIRTAWDLLKPSGVNRIPGPDVPLLLQIADGGALFWSSLVGSAQIWMSQNVRQLMSPTGFWGGGGMPGNALTVWLALAALGVCWTLVFLTVRLAAVGLAKTWMRAAAPPPSSLMTRTAASLTREWLGPQWLLRRRRAILALNPVAWLDDARGVSRIGRWLWVGLAGAVLCVAVYDHPDARGVASTLAFALTPIVIGVAFSASASFRRERETGALEILLVTPLTPRRILLGRLLGLLGTFGAALALLTLSVGIALAGRDPGEGITPPVGPVLYSQLLATWLAPTGVAVLGLGFGLRWTGFLAAWYRSLAAWYLIPYAAGFALVAGASLSDYFWGTAYNPWSAWSFYGNRGNYPTGDPYYPTLLGHMAASWWWPFMGLVTLVRLAFLGFAWRLGTRALAERLFLGRPHHAGVDGA